MSRTRCGAEAVLVVCLAIAYNAIDTYYGRTPPPASMTPQDKLANRLFDACEAGKVSDVKRLLKVGCVQSFHSNQRCVRSSEGDVKTEILHAQSDIGHWR